MNPAFILIVILIGIAAWFLASSLYKPIGRFIGKIKDDAIQELTDVEEEEDE